ncbi:MAG TPA: hypothetical protein VIB08_03285, partial [Thermoanaerobaculia bacterium]
PDGAWVLAHTARAPKPQLWLYPAAAGEKRVLATGNLSIQSVAEWLPDGKRIVFTGNEPEHGSRLFLMDIAGGAPRALSPEGYRSFSRGVSPDGKFVLAVGPDRKRYFYPLDGGEPTPVNGLATDETPSGYSADGRFLYVCRRQDIPAKVSRLEIATGRREHWKDLAPADGAGIVDISPVIPTPDGNAYVYGYSRTLSDLYLVSGVR